MWEQLAYVHEPGAELLLHVFNPDKQVYHLSHTLCTAILLLYITSVFSPGFCLGESQDLLF